MKYSLNFSGNIFGNIVAFCLIVVLFGDYVLNLYGTPKFLLYFSAGLVIYQSLATLIHNAIVYAVNKNK